MSIERALKLSYQKQERKEQTFNSLIKPIIAFTLFLFGDNIGMIEIENRQRNKCPPQIQIGHNN